MPTGSCQTIRANTVHACNVSADKIDVGALRVNGLVVDERNLQGGGSVLRPTPEDPSTGAQNGFGAKATYTAAGPVGSGAPVGVTDAGQLGLMSVDPAEARRYVGIALTDAVAGQDVQVLTSGYAMVKYKKSPSAAAAGPVLLGANVYISGVSAGYAGIEDDPADDPGYTVTGDPVTRALHIGYAAEAHGSDQGLGFLFVHLPEKLLPTKVYADITPATDLGASLGRSDLRFSQVHCDTLHASTSSVYLGDLHLENIGGELVANGQNLSKTLKHFKYNEETDQLEADRAMETTLNSLYLGDKHKMSSGAENIFFTNLGTDINFYPMWGGLRDQSDPANHGAEGFIRPSGRIYTDVFNLPLGGDPVPGTSIGYSGGNPFSVNIAGLGIITTSAEDVDLSVTKLVYKLYIKGLQVYQQRLPGTGLVAAGDLIEWWFDHPVEIHAGTTIFAEITKVRISDDEDQGIFMVQEGATPNPDGTVRYQAIVHNRLFDDKNLLIEFPYLKYTSMDFSGGATTVKFTYLGEVIQTYPYGYLEAEDNLDGTSAVKITGGRTIIQALSTVTINGAAPADVVAELNALFQMNEDMTDTLKYFRYNEATDKLEASRAIETTLNSLYLGEKHKMSSGAENIFFTNLGTDINFYPMWGGLRDQSDPLNHGADGFLRPSGRIYADVFSLPLGGAPVPGTSIGYSGGNFFGVNIAGLGITTTSAEDVDLSVTKLVYKLYVNGLQVYQQRLPNTGLVAAGDLIEWWFDHPVEIHAGTTIFAEITKVSIATDADQGIFMVQEGATPNPDGTTRYQAIVHNRLFQDEELALQCPYLRHTSMDFSGSTSVKLTYLGEVIQTYPFGYLEAEDNLDGTFAVKIAGGKTIIQALSTVTINGAAPADVVAELTTLFQQTQFLPDLRDRLVALEQAFEITNTTPITTYESLEQRIKMLEDTFAS